MSQSVFKSKEEMYEKPPLQPRIVPGGTEDYSQYLKVAIKDGGKDEEWTGQPFLANIYEGTDKKTGKPYYSSAFQIIDHKSKEILRANVYLEGMEDNVKFKKGSAGFELVKSIDAVNDNPTKDNAHV